MRAKPTAAACERLQIPHKPYHVLYSTKHLAALVFRLNGQCMRVKVRLEEIEQWY